MAVFFWTQDYGNYQEHTDEQRIGGRLVLQGRPIDSVVVTSDLMPDLSVAPGQRVGSLVATGGNPTFSPYLSDKVDIGRSGTTREIPICQPAYSSRTSVISSSTAPPSKRSTM